MTSGAVGQYKSIFTYAIQPEQKYKLLFTGMDCHVDLMFLIQKIKCCRFEDEFEF